MPKFKSNVTVSPNESIPVANPEGLTPPFAQVLLEVIEDRRISAGAFRLYALLIGLSRGFGSCWPSQATLASRLGISLRTIRNWLKELEATGLIEIEHRCSLPGQEQSNIYRLNKLVSRQTERPRQDSATPPGKILPQTPVTVCPIPRQNLAAESHEDLHESKYKHTTPEQAGDKTNANPLEGCVSDRLEKKSEIPETGKATSDSLVSMPSGSFSSERVTKPASKPGGTVGDLSQENLSNLKLLCTSLEKYGVAADRAKGLSRKLCEKHKDTAYVEAWANWISQQPTTRNVAAYLVRMLEQLAPVPIAGQSAPPSAQSQPPPLDPATIKQLPKLLEIAERDLREARSEHERQSAQARISRYRAMETQLKAQIQEQNQEGEANYAILTTIAS